jgi:aminomethyltransferase
MVVNGACKAKDIQHFQRYLSSEYQVTMDHDESRQLLALQVSERLLWAWHSPLWVCSQGDGAKLALGRLAPSLNLSKMNFMTSIENVTVAGIPNCRVTRCGYTGEDGFEISVAENNTVALAQYVSLSHLHWVTHLIFW